MTQQFPDHPNAAAVMKGTGHSQAQPTKAVTLTSTSFLKNAREWEGWEALFRKEQEREALFPESVLTGQQCLPETLRTILGHRCSRRCPVEILHSTPVSTTLGRPRWSPEEGTVDNLPGLNAGQVPHCLGLL